MKKLISLALALCLISALFLGCSKTDSTTIRIAALKGPTGMGIVKLMGEEYKNYAISIESAPDAVRGKFINGELDVAAVPVNLASVLYNKLEKDVVVLAVTTLGVLYILENGNEIQSVNDLAGMTIGATGQASTPEYILNYIRDKNGLTGKVEVEYQAEHAALGTLMADGQVSIGMLPEPNVTATLAKNDSLRIALDLTEEWGKVCDTELVQGVLIARKSFVDEHKSAIEQLLNDYKASSEFVVNNVDEAAKLIVDAGILPAEPIAKKAIPNCNIVFTTGAAMKSAVSNMLDVLFTANPKSIGGEQPQDDFYYGA